jgi:hypothetical protein
MKSKFNGRISPSFALGRFDSSESSLKSESSSIESKKVLFISSLGLHLVILFLHSGSVHSIPFSL